MPEFWNIHGISRSRLDWFKLLGDAESGENSDPVLQFLKEWWNEEDYIVAHSSGSTGSPKKIELQKSFLRQSAQATAMYFGLRPHDKLLLCIPTAFIGGKMMLVRADVCDLNISCIEPTSSPEIPNEQFEFCSMTPMQLSLVIERSPASLKNIKRILLGGSPVESELLSKIDQLETEVFIGYGMTETGSHVAVRKLTEHEEFFSATEGFEFSIDSERKLIIYHAASSQEWYSNDIVELRSNKSFKWLGRADFVINSGGVKIHPEEIENVLSGKIGTPFYISSKEDGLLGQKLVLIVQSDKDDPLLRRQIESIVAELPSLKRPKEIIFKREFRKTENGKLIRERY